MFYPAIFCMFKGTLHNVFYYLLDFWLLNGLEQSDFSTFCAIFPIFNNKIVINHKLSHFRLGLSRCLSGGE